MDSNALPDWHQVFEQVCRRGQTTLEWGLPEQWVQAELFASLLSMTRDTGWKPLSTEVPYLTYYPVFLPKPATRDWRQDGAIKWVDLCLRHETHNSWCWLELKARRCGDEDRRDESTRSALSALAKDYVGLHGLDPRKTADLWQRPDNLTKAYWFETELAPIANDLRKGTHYFVSAYLQLNQRMDPEHISPDTAMERIQSWFHWRAGKSTWNKHDVPNPSIHTTPVLTGGHGLMLCQSGPWTS